MRVYFHGIKANTAGPTHDIMAHYYSPYDESNVFDSPRRAIDKATALATIDGWIKLKVRKIINK